MYKGYYERIGEARSDTSDDEKNDRNNSRWQNKENITQKVKIHDDYKRIDVKRVCFTAITLNSYLVPFQLDVTVL